MKKLKPKSRFRRLLRWTVSSVIVLCVLAGISLWVATRSWFIVYLVSSELEGKLGGAVSIAEAKYEGKGRITFTGFSLRARSLNGPAAEIASIGQAAVTVNLTRLLAGSVEVIDVELNNVQLRVSEDSHEAGRMNVMALEPEWKVDEDSDFMLPPQVQIRSAVLESGSHDGAEFKLLGKRHVTGYMRPSDVTSGWYDFDLVEVNQVGQALGDRALHITGHWNVATNECHSWIDGLELDDRIYSMCPEAVRLWWDQMHLDGRVNGIEMHFEPDVPFWIEFSVEDIVMTLPIETEGLWARYRSGEFETATSRPRLFNRSGTIRITRDSLHLDLTGSLGSSEDDVQLGNVPYQLSLTIPSLPQMQWEDREEWAETVLKHAPFDITFRMDEFSLKEDDSGSIPAVDVPTVVAKVLSKFQMTNWVLSSSVHVTRGEPSVDDNGELHVAAPEMEGQIFIDQASGQYHKFPYKLDDVDAYLQVDNDRVIVHYLTGTGSDGSNLRITGEIAPPENDAKVSLRITGSGLPLDNRLYDALRSNEREAFDSLFHKPSYESLIHAGMLSDDASANPNGFQLGGRIDIDLRITRDFGPDQPTQISGIFDIQSAGALYEKFPYPLWVTAGRLIWAEDSVTIDESDHRGVSFQGPGGGHGVITGRVDFPKIDGKRNLNPDLHLSIDDEALTDFLYAAMPVSEEIRLQREAQSDPATWPGALISHEATLIRELSFEGMFSSDGFIRPDDNNRTNFQFTISIHDTASTPTHDFAALLGASDSFLPTDALIENIQGDVIVSRDAVHWDGIHGNLGDCQITCDGSVIRGEEGTSTTLGIDLLNMPLQRNLIQLSEPSRAERLTAMWNRYEPTGTIDVSWNRETNPLGETQMQISFQPRDVSISLGDELVALQHSGGKIHFERGALYLENVSVNILGANDRMDGTLGLDGLVDLSTELALFDITGTWLDGRFESPLIRDLMRITSGDDVVTEYLQLSPSGKFDADFQVRQSDTEPDRHQFECELKPTTLALRMKDMPIYAQIATGSIRVRPQEFRIQQIRGRHAGGEFYVDGSISLNDAPVISLDFGYSGRIRSNQVEVLIPEVVNNALNTMELTEGGPSELRNAQLQLEQITLGNGETAWKTDFSGELEVTNTSLIAGLQFQEIDGQFDIKVNHSPDAPPRMAIYSNAQHAKIIGHRLNDVVAEIHLTEDGTAIEMPSLLGVMNNGAICARAIGGIGERLDYRTDIELVGVSLEGLLSPTSSESELTNDNEKSDIPQISNDGLFASFSLTGLRGQPETRRGRGIARLLGDRLAAVPIVLRIVQLSQFTFPFGSDLNYGDAQWYLVGDQMIFENILFESSMGDNAMLQLIGEGEMNFDTLELNTLFRTRGGVAVVRDIIGGVTDQLYLIEVTGPLNDPKASVVALPGMH